MKILVNTTFVASCWWNSKS